MNPTIPAHQIRRAEPDEAPAIAAVLQAAFLVYQPLYTPGGFAATTPTETEIRRRWDAGPGWQGPHGDS